jgi:hypothetical protein
MVHDEQFRVLIDLAEDRGFDWSNNLVSLLDGEIKTSLTSIVSMSQDKILFNHRFVKCIVGEFGLDPMDGGHWEGIHETWQKVIAKMALLPTVEERIAYLYEHKRKD